MFGRCGAHLEGDTGQLSSFEVAESAAVSAESRSDHAETRCSAQLLRGRDHADLVQAVEHRVSRLSVYGAVYGEKAISWSPLTPA